MKLFLLAVVLFFYTFPSFAQPICVSRRKEGSGMLYSAAEQNILCLDASNKIQSSDRVNTYFLAVIPMPWNWLEGTSDEDLKNSMNSLGFSEVAELSVLISPNYRNAPNIDPLKVHESISGSKPSSYCVISRLNKFESGLNLKKEVFEFVSIHCPSEKDYSAPSYFQGVSIAEYSNLMSQLGYSKVFATDDSDDFLGIKAYWDFELFKK